MDVIAGYKGPFIEHHEWNHTFIQGDQGLRIDGADLCERKLNEIARTAARILYG